MKDAFFLGQAGLSIFILPTHISFFKVCNVGNPLRQKLGFTVAYGNF